MKKFLSLTVALAMTVAMVPATAFAKSDMKISRQITAESNDLIYNGTSTLQGQTKVTREAPYLTLKADGAFRSPRQTFRLKLTNAEWLNDKDKTGNVVNFETQGQANTRVVDAGGTGESLIDGTGGSGGSGQETQLKALQDKLTELADKGASTVGTFTNFTEAVEGEFSDKTSDAFVGEDGTGNGIIDGNGFDKKLSVALLKWTTDAVRLGVTTTAGATGIARIEWEALMTATIAYRNALIDSRVAETALAADLDESDDYKSKQVKTALKIYNDGVKAIGYDTAVLEYDKFNGAILAEIEKDVALTDIAAAAKSFKSASAAASELNKLLFPVDKIGDLDFVAYKALADTLIGSALKAGTSHYDLILTALDTDNTVTAKSSIVGNELDAFNTKLGGSTGAVVRLDAQAVADKYTALAGNISKFKAYLVSDGKITVAADQEKIIELVVAYINAGTSTLALLPNQKGTVTIERVTDTLAMVTIETSTALPNDAEVIIPLYTKITGGETATVEVDARDSEFSNDSKIFAKVSEGSTTSFVDTTKNFYDGDTLNTIYIDENAAGTFELGKTITLKLSSGFKWGDSSALLQTAGGKIKLLNGGALLVDYTTVKVDGNEITFQLKGGLSTNPSTISFANMVIKEDGADFGTTAKVTVDGAGVTKKVVELGTYSDFGLTLTAESKALPLIYAGSFDDDNETLRVTFEETVQSSWITDRKTEFTLPDNVKFVDVEVKRVDNLNVSVADLEAHLRANIDGGKTSIDARYLKIAKDKKAKFEAIYTITADPTFTGDVELAAGGPAVGGEKLTKAVATVASPLTVKSTVNEVKIDYRNVAVNSITITEAEAGLWEKGDKITLKVEEMQFESGIKAEIVSGDMKLEKLDGDNVKVNKKNGTVTIQVKSTSSATPAEIKIDGIQLYLDRSLPVGDYELSIVTTADNKFVPSTGNKEKDLLFANYCVVTKDFGSKFGQTAFDTDAVVALKDFVKVVTAGRDQGDGFTTKIVVPVGSDKIMAGTKEITIDAPAYINADGYTMLPVRAVIDALNGIAVVRWDDASKTCTISYANKVFAMTVGSKTMNMNGVSTPLLAAPEIKTERIFLPLRDLGYALGLADNKIAWDAATNTATLN